AGWTIMTGQFRISLIPVSNYTPFGELAVNIVTILLLKFGVNLKPATLIREFSEKRHLVLRGSETALDNQVP
ncbi:MAG: hypothetical protein U1D67_05855, partial [Dehalococcoidia bacterium]|nr:hypothetical protein [Dehalococcoidia bacterium]